jgi:sugar lactone lactonase YvrE
MSVFRWVLMALALGVVVAGTVGLRASDGTAGAPEQRDVPFAGGLVALSDADTEAQAYIDDDIGPAIGQRDVLTFIRPNAGGKARVEGVQVSNSVWGPPLTVDTTPDGRYAFVLEVKRQRDADDRSFEEDLAFTTRVSVVDLHRDRPRVVQVTDTGGFAAHSLSVSPRGDYLAVANWAAPGEESGIPEGQGRQISIIPFREGRLGEPQLFGMNNIQGPFAIPNTIAWHPSGRFLGITSGPRNLVAFYRVGAGADGRLDVRPWGEPVPVGRFPLTGAWTPDGRFFISGLMEWAEPEVSDRNSPPGALSLVRFDDDEADGLEHTPRRSGDVGINPEGLAVSPDGRYIATVNMRYSHLPEHFDRLRPPTTSSITLLELDPESGQTRVVEEQSFDGVLPEGVAFDRTGRRLAVAVFDFHGAKRGTGAIQFWRLRGGDDPRLEQLPQEITTVRGAHSLADVP